MNWRALFIPPGQGLTAFFDALAYGFLGGLIGLGVGGMLSFTLKGKPLTYAGGAGFIFIIRRTGPFFS